MTAVLPARPSAAERRAAPSLAAAVRDLDRRRARSRQRMIGASELGECRRHFGLQIEHQALRALYRKHLELDLGLRFEREPRVVARGPDATRDDLRLRRR